MEKLNIDKFKNKFIVTGATGWVGRNFLHELQKIIPMEFFNKKVFAFGSKSSQIYSTAYKKNIIIPIYPLSESNNLLAKDKNFFTIHTAFLTREKISNYGLEKYIEINKNILRNLEYILEISNPKKSVLISSGAAESIEKKDANDIDIQKDPYGVLKYEEEQNFKKLSNCLIMRIFGLTGKFIRDPNIFAFGNFLLSAKKKEPILINSNRDVIRSYGFAGEIAKVSIKWLLSDENSTDLINSCTHTINLLELANLITDIYGLPDVIYDIDMSLKKDIYISPNTKFINFLENFNIKPSSIKNQIIETYKYLNNDLITEK